MSVYRPRIIASLCLLLAAFGVAACAVLVRPAPAGAASNRSRRVVFPPVVVLRDQSVECYYFNSGTRPTPPATLTFVDRFGPVLEEVRSDSVVPGQMGGAAYINPGPTPQVISVVVTFDPPAAGQAIPNPFPGSVHVFGGGGLLGLIGPAR